MAKTETAIPKTIGRRYNEIPDNSRQVWANPTFSLLQFSQAEVARMWNDGRINDDYVLIIKFLRLAKFATTDQISRALNKNVSDEYLSKMVKEMFLNSFILSEFGFEDDLKSPTVLHFYTLDFGGQYLNSIIGEDMTNWRYTDLMVGTSLIKKNLIQTELLISFNNSKTLALRDYKQFKELRIGNKVVKTDFQASFKNRKNTSTIIDFVGATDLFYDAAWDGIPEDEIVTDETGKIGNEKTPKKSQTNTVKEPSEEYGDKKEKLIIELSNGRAIKVIDIDTRYIDENGKPLTVREFLEKLVGELPAIYQDENHLREIWANPDTRKELLEQLGSLGFDKEQLDALRNMIASPECDIFDVLSHISFSSDLKTRKERAIAVRDDNFFAVYQNLKAREFLEYVLNQYEKFGIEELQREKLGDLVKLKLGTTKDAKIVFGDMKNLLGAYYQLQQNIYQIV